MGGDGQPQADAAVALGKQLSRSRLERGLSQRALTKQLGLSAHSNIADYESGRRIPPRDIVIQCERVLGLAQGTLVSLYEQALRERATARSNPPPHLPSRTSEPQPPRLPKRLIALAAGGVLVLGVGAAAWNYSGGGDAPVQPSSNPAVQVWDGNDPKAAGCADDATTLDSQPVTTGGTPEGALVGWVDLRYSPLCHAAWPKFMPIANMNTPVESVAVEAYRPIDRVKTSFQLPGLSQAYGDVLQVGVGCVQASATVVLKGSQDTATGTTACLPANGS